MIVVAISLAATVALIQHAPEGDDSWWADAAGVAVFVLAVVAATLLSRPSSSVPASTRRAGTARTLGGITVAAGSLVGAVFLLRYERPYATSFIGAYYQEPWWSDPAAVVLLLGGVVAAGLLLRDGREPPTDV